MQAQAQVQARAQAHLLLHGQTQTKSCLSVSRIARPTHPYRQISQYARSHSAMPPSRLHLPLQCRLSVSQPFTHRNATCPPFHTGLAHPLCTYAATRRSPLPSIPCRSTRSLAHHVILACHLHSHAPLSISSFSQPQPQPHLASPPVSPPTPPPVSPNIPSTGVGAQVDCDRGSGSGGGSGSRVQCGSLSSEARGGEENAYLLPQPPRLQSDVDQLQQQQQAGSGDGSSTKAHAHVTSDAADDMDPVQRLIAARYASAMAERNAAAASPAFELPSVAAASIPSPFESSVEEFNQNFDAFFNKQPMTATFVAATRGSSLSKEHEVFANSDTPLARIMAFGFDFDYTLANYNDNVHVAIYHYAQDYLVRAMGYPSSLLQRSFDLSFAIRGLHFDVRTGYLFKLDTMGKIATATIYLGRERVPIADVVEAYRGISITSDYRARYLHHLVDLFAISESTLLADVIQTFRELNQSFSPDYIYRDVRRAIEHVHVSGLFHSNLEARPHFYLDKNPQLVEFLLRLRDAGRHTFLLTNSPYAFVDAGMRYMMTSLRHHSSAKKHGIHSEYDWRLLFDVCITSARKPAFFTREGSFRRLDIHDDSSSSTHAVGRHHHRLLSNTPSSGGMPGGSHGGFTLSWQPVHTFKRGEVYTEGSLSELMKLTNRMRQEAADQQARDSGSAAEKVRPLRGHEYLYFGDHISADLSAPWQSAKWRTVAIVREIAKESAVQASPRFKSALKRLLQLEALINYGQRIETDEAKEKVEILKKERQQAKSILLCMFNAHFGSVFRTSSQRTEFFSDLGRFADIYTSSVDNFNNYGVNHCFYAKRQFYPHEVPLEWDVHTSNLEDMDAWNAHATGETLQHSIDEMT